MATVPLSGTNIRLLSGVPFHNDYKNTRWFDTKTEQTNYFLNKPTTYQETQHTFQRIEGRTYIRVNKSIDELWGTNYLMFKNTSYNDKWFYGFVTKLEYVNKALTYVHFEIDVFQTWKFDMNFKPSFVVREHRPLWNADGSPVINTVDEGLNYGTEYETVSVENYKPNDDILFLVIVTKETFHTAAKAITPNYNGMPQPLSYYIHPFRLVGGEPIVMIDGVQKTYSTVIEALKGIFTQDSAVNNVVSLYVTEFPGKWIYNAGGMIDMDSQYFEWVEIADNVNPNFSTFYVKNMNQYDSTTENMGDKYLGFTKPTESKLLMHPYTVTIIDDFKGNRLEVKNEYIMRNDLQLRVRGSLGTSNKIAYMVDDYRVDSALPSDQRLTQTIEHALINNSPNDISILNDFLSAYLQGNRNQIENQKSAIIWNGTIGALTGAMVGGAQSTFQTRAGLRGNPVGIAAAGLQGSSGVGQAIIEMQGLQAKKADVNNTPAQLVKMGGNSAFDFGNNFTGVYVIKKQITDEYRKKLSDFFNMFGYKTNEVKVPNFHTRQNWNYVQTSNCIITGNFNNEDIQELKNVFDNGITLWHTDDIGNYALANGVI